MEEKKQIKVSLGAVISVFIIILLTVALVGMYCYYNFVVIPKYEVANNETENVVESNNNNANEEKNESKEDNEISTENVVKIEGEYSLVGDENTEGLVYKFEGNTVKRMSLSTAEGTFEVIENKIKITYTREYELGEYFDILPNEQYDELTIVDENTLTSQRVINGVVYNGKYVKDSKFVSENPKISFEYPNDWTIETNSWNIWNRTIKAPEEGVKIIIKKEENQGNAELKDLISLDWGSNVLDEGTISTANNYKCYFKTYTFGDAQYAIKAKNVMIDTGKGDYYSISLIIGGENMLNMSHEQVFNKYESVLNKLVGTIQF